jgi:type II secretory ATPase GspE/PulE/Tfp pilus assembly ATPase PilB-like protein
MRLMQDDVVQKVLDGVTSMEEAMRVVYVDGE